MDEFEMDQECKRSFRTLTDAIGVLLGERWLLAKGSGDSAVQAATMLVTVIVSDAFCESVPGFDPRSFALALARGEGADL